MENQGARRELFSLVRTRHRCRAKFTSVSGIRSRICKGSVKKRYNGIAAERECFRHHLKLSRKNDLKFCLFVLNAADPECPKVHADLGIQNPYLDTNILDAMNEHKLCKYIRLDRSQLGTFSFLPSNSTAEDQNFRRTASGGLSEPPGRPPTSAGISQKDGVSTGQPCSHRMCPVRLAPKNFRRQKVERTSARASPSYN